MSGTPAERLGQRLGLAWTLVRTDLKVRYHGTLGGFLWALLKPLGMFAVLASVFSLIFPGENDYRLNLILGLFLWDFFAEGSKVGLIALHQKGYLLTKARFPLSLVVLTAPASALLTALVFTLSFLAWLAALGRAPSPLGLVLLAFYLLALLALVEGIALGASVLFLRYRDLNQVWEVLTQAGFFLAPIIWPLGVLPERYHLWLYAWPPTPVIEFARATLLRGEPPGARAHLLLSAFALTVLGLGTLIFRRLAPSSAEHV